MSLPRLAAAQLACMSSAVKNTALAAMAQALRDNYGYILEQNSIDTQNAVKNGITKAMLDRLTLTKERIFSMADGICEVCALPDPVGETVEGTVRPNGLEIVKKRVPIGVIGIIYEARPNVTSDAAALCIKIGKCCFFARRQRGN